MTRPRYIPSRKRRTREHVIADLGVNYVERQALLCGYSVERRYHDYGTDLLIDTYDEDGEAENGNLLVQVKATDHVLLVQHGSSAACRVERSHVRSWLGEIMPVLLVLYDAVTDIAYWVDVRDCFRSQRSWPREGFGRLTLRLPKEQIVDPSAFRQWARRKAERFQRVWGIIHDD